MKSEYPKQKAWEKNTRCTSSQYEDGYQRSIENPDLFWKEVAQRVSWSKPFEKVADWSFQKPISIRWFLHGKLNVSENCLDRHLKERGEKIALIFEPNDPKDDVRKMTYRELHRDVCKFANVLVENGVRRGDRVTIYMPMIPEAAIAMLACTRIGAIHSVVFGGFSSDALADRIRDCQSQFVITADEGVRATKFIPLKKNVDQALEKCSDVKKVFVVRRTGGECPWLDQRDVWYHEAMKHVSHLHQPVAMDSEDPLFILYTSGSTGKPKGVLHTTGGYLVYASFTHEYVFDLREEDVYWCTADIGWITGHSYIVYGPLANGATSVIFEGVPNYPDYSRFWNVVDKHKVSIFYTAPTAIRALMREGEEYVRKTSRESLRILGSVGEPINPEAWRWYYEVVGQSRCPIVDTWWQTETGGIMISPLPGAMDLKPGSATKPFFGIQPVIVGEKGEILTGACEGRLCISASWPGMMRTVFQNHERFESTYFQDFPGMYFTGDGCRRDDNGYYWITGRVDDVINVSGHRLGTAEVESALVSHESVSEAAVVGYPHELKGQGIYAYVTLKEGIRASEPLKHDLVQWVRKEIGPIATPDQIQFSSSLPKTRSGKIMRRILRKIAEGKIHELGDISTLQDPGVVQNLIEDRK